MVKSVTDRCGAVIYARRSSHGSAAAGAFAQYEQRTDRPRPSSGLQTQTQVGYPQQIVSSRHEIGPRLRPVHSAIATAPQAAHRFHPAKDFFDPFAKALAGTVTGATRRASIQSRDLSPILARRVRRDFPLPTPGHEFLLVICFVPAEGPNPGFVQLPVFSPCPQGP